LEVRSRTKFRDLTTAQYPLGDSDIYPHRNSSGLPREPPCPLVNLHPMDTPKIDEDLSLQRRQRAGMDLDLQTPRLLIINPETVSTVELSYNCIAITCLYF
jgi:hypothetical protein